MAIEVFIDEEQIGRKIAAMADLINSHFQGKELTVVCVLNGSFMFTADLVREINLPIEIEFIKCSSYHEGTSSSGEVKFDLDFKKSLANKHVLVVEDIVDTGLTLTKLMEKIKSMKPASLKLAALLHKPARTTHPVKIDYLGFEIPDKFVIGYGLDYAGKYRELPYIGIYAEE